MVEQLTNDFVSDVQNRATNSTMEDGKWTRAYIDSTSADITDGNGISTALIAALFANPELLSQLQSQYSIWQRNMETDGIDPVISTVVRLATDGLWFSEMFGLGKLDAELREQVIQKLTNMIK
nr:hypothetical protein [Cohnella sp. WQ 127256]